MHYDVVVLGGGSAGYVAGSILARNNLKVAVIEKKAFGGVCVNSGCVPSIFLSDISFLFSRLEELGNYKGLNISISKDNFFKKRDEIINYLSDAGRKLIEDAGGDTFIGEGKINGDKEIEVNGEKIGFEKLIIATGSSSVPPQIDGIDYAISEDEAVNLHEIPSSMVVIGGGYAGTEIAQIFARLGSNVTLITRGKILKEITEDARNILLDSFDWDNIQIYENTEIKHIKDEKVITNKGEFKGEIIVYATGRKPNFPYGLELLGVKSFSNGIEVNNNMETDNPRVHAIGDVIDKEKKVAHAAMSEGMIAALDILGIKETIDYNSIPQVIYTDPQIGIVGNISDVSKINKFPITATTRATISGFREGYAKIGIDNSGKIVYGEIVSNIAEELINILSLAIREKMNIKDLIFSSFIHPSLSEAIINCARSFYNLDVDRFKGMKNES
ncbi:dihydrolipoyl dehydrogenase family protein [Acidianus brierleyi]|uniref:Pyridine nucleotide-disulfide oxidoreductase n=1 Tax=Acidianus brierleyi TaxID=41673 RepID=A0A2U9IGF5_9CREN|nr:NAD(P)/FAD-dependent oxidoreductase [Acidianus brierleyi]AWR95113.1 pyridine nucleotide-disulfide oxidoreductase [Acidianus brierleyi]